MIKISKKTREQKINVVVVLGPTACGKSDLAVSIAKKFDGEVISADSRQVYRGMDIGTGKITHREMKGVRHHLLDVADPKDRFSAGDYRMLAQKAIDNIASRGKLPIICGGTGFYIDAVLNDGLLSNVQPNPQLRKKLEKKTAAQLLLALKKIDQKRWKTMAASPSESKNARRLIRAIEIAMALKAMKKTGKEGRRDHEQWQAPESTGGKRVQMPSLRHKYIPIFIGVKPSMEELKKRIRTRLLKRIDDGMLAEARRLHAPRTSKNPNGSISWKRMDELGLEYRYEAAYLQGKTSKEEFIERLNTAIWHFAKRQMTWFKRNRRIRWFAPDDLSSIEHKVGAFLR